MGNSEMSYANNENVVVIITDVDPPEHDNPPEQEPGSERDKGGKRKREVKSSKGGTTHLFRHINGTCLAYKRATNQETTRGQTLLSFPKNASNQASSYVWKFDQERSRMDLTEPIINRELPFNFVEDKSFQKYVLGVNPKVHFVTRNTMRSDCMKIYEVEKNKLKEIFSNSNPRVCLTTDGWTSKRDLPFMALTAHFIDQQWRLQKKIINFVMVPVKATGENLTDIIINCLLEWNLDKICTVTMDNYSANDAVAKRLQERYSSRGLMLLNGRSVQVRCWGHILNLIVHEGLDEIKVCIQRVRNAVKYVKASPKRKLEFI
ncbi:hypothetical protein ACH5RR_000509 [Cinchona calisaya]|uniref:Zinc finger BED domain-containing protein RICESLEEPER 2-like n=1 Tax=Cinchona calisaya TaxID=153742 RepID=A0ABD3B0Z2_9GENT